MRIRIKYESSEGPHLIDLNQEELQNLVVGQEITVRQNNPEKTLEIQGTPTELRLLANALIQRANTP